MNIIEYIIQPLSPSFPSLLLLVPRDARMTAREEEQRQLQAGPGRRCCSLCVTQAAGCEHAAAGAVWLFHFFLWMGPQNIFSGRSLKWHQMPGCRQQNQILNNIQINTLSSEANHGWGGLLVIPQGQMGQRQLLLGVCSWAVLVVLLGRQERGSTLPNLSQQHQELEFPNKWHLSR